jgi:hypothetical protein
VLKCQWLDWKWLGCKLVGNGEVLDRRINVMSKVVMGIIGNEFWVCRCRWDMGVEVRYVWWSNVWT